VWKFTPDLYAKAPHLKAVFTPAAGKDWVQQDPSGHVPVYFSAYHGIMMAESLLGMILYFNCGFYKTLENQRKHVWDRDAQDELHRLKDKHVLLIGYGSIGKHCARLLQPLGCRISGVQRKHHDGIDPETGVRYLTFDSLSWELGAADHAVLLLPGGSDTHHSFTRDLLKCMKKTAYLYNLGRGSVVAEDDVVWALENKIIAGAGLDVFEQEPLPASSKLWDFTNVLILPHTSAGYMEYGERFVEELTGKFGKVIK